MTRLVVGGRECTDAWEHLAVGDAPGDRGFTVGIVRWWAERRDLLAHADCTGCSLGVRLAIDSDPGTLAEDVGRFSLIVIEIPDSSDGRFFSVAARVREHLRYGGELRVTGDVAPDQIAFMQRCGINAFELGDGVDIERFIRRYERFYQSSGSMTTSDNQIRLARRRLARSRGKPPFADGEPSPRSSRPVACLDR